MKRILSLILVLVLVLGSMPMAFADENMTGGENLYELGLVKGDDEGNLMEDQMLTREQMMVMLARLNGVEGEAMDYDLPSTFNDVNADSYYAPYIAYAEVQEWTNGTGDGTFTPKGEITAQMVATYMMRVLGYEVNWDTAVAEAAVLGIMDDNPSEKFLRGNAFDMMFDAVNTKMANSEMTLGQKLGKLPMEEEVVAEDVTIDSAVALTTNMVEVALDEDMDAPEMVDASIFMVTDEDDAELTIESVEFAPWDSDDYTVLVTLEEALESGSAYTIASGDSEAEFGGMDADEDAPDNVTVANSTDPYEITLEFDEAVAMDTLEVEIEENISGDELAVLDMAYDGSDKIVLTTGEQSKSLYNVTVTAIEDLSGNANEDDLEDTFIGKAVPTDDLEVVSAVNDGYAKAIVTFSEKLNPDTVDAAAFTVTENISDDEVVVLTAEVDEDDETLVNLTLESSAKELYNVKVDGVEDKYGNELGDEDEASFIGVDMPDEDFTYEAEATSNTTVEVDFANDVEVDSALDLANYAIEENISDDELVVLSAEIDEDDDSIVILTTESMKKELYNMTVTDVDDIYGNTVDTDDDANVVSFIGLKIADEITAIESISISGRELTIGFDQRVGDNATRVTKYSIDEGIGYPNKVEKHATDKKKVVLTLPKTYNDTVYTVTVTGLENSDGILMDADEELTDTFVGTSTPDTDEVDLKGAAASNKLVLNLYFNKDVEDLTGFYDDDTNLLVDDADLVFEFDGGDKTLADLDNGYYAYIGDNDQVLSIALDYLEGDFDFSEDVDVVISNADVDGTSTAQLVGDDSDPSDLEIDGVSAIDAETIKVYFNQPVRKVVEASAKITDAGVDYADIDFATAYSNAAKTQWTFALDTAFADENEYKLVVENINFASTHDTVTTDVLDLTDEIKFAGDTTVAEFTDGVKAVSMTDEKTIEVYFEEDMNAAQAETADNYNFYDTYSSTVAEMSDGNAFDNTGTFPAGATYDIGDIDYDDETYVATITIRDTFAAADSVEMWIDNSMPNRQGTKTLAEDAVVETLVMDDADAALLDIDDVEVNTTGSVITVTLTQNATYGTNYTDGTDLVVDFDITVDGNLLDAADITSVTAADNTDTIEITLAANVANGESVKVEANDTTNVTGDYNGELLDEDASMIIVK